MKWFPCFETIIENGLIKDAFYVLPLAFRFRGGEEDAKAKGSSVESSRDGADVADTVDADLDLLSELGF